MTAVTGVHDEPEIYAEPAGDPGLVGPGSVSWEIHSDMSAIGIAGTAAIIMEILHPSVMAGVHDSSNYRTDPLRRARNTAGYVVATTFGNTQAAERTIARVRRMHERVNGTRPDGEPYRAMDPTLIGWVHTCIPWAVMRAFERYTRPLSQEERDRYLAEQSVIGLKAGAGPIPVTTGELEEYVQEMRPRLAVNEQTQEFFEFLLTPSPAAVSLPGPMERKAVAVEHIARVLLPDGVFFGHTILGQSAMHTRLGRRLLATVNKRGTFDNLDDTEAGLRAILERSFREVDLRTHRATATFVAKRPIDVIAPGD